MHYNFTFIPLTYIILLYFFLLLEVIVTHRCYIIIMMPIL